MTIHVTCTPYIECFRPRVLVPFVSSQKHIDDCFGNLPMYIFRAANYGLIIWGMWSAVKPVASQKLATYVLGKKNRLFIPPSLAIFHGRTDTCNW